MLYYFQISLKIKLIAKSNYSIWENIMAEESSLRQLKRRAYLDYHQDGIIDVLIGVAILGFGLWIWLDQPIFAFLCLFCFGSYIQLKNAITVPRFGYVRFQEGKRETGLLVWLGIGLVLLALVVGILFLLGPDRVGLAPFTFLRKFHVYVMSSIGAVLMAIFGLWSGIRRLLAYALFLIAALVITSVQDLDRSVPLLLTGSVLMLMGLILMIRFIRRNPSEPGQVNHAV
jgi:hypothetical protein